MNVRVLAAILIRLSLDSGANDAFVRIWRMLWKKSSIVTGSGRGVLMAIRSKVSGALVFEG